MALGAGRWLVLAGLVAGCATGAGRREGRDGGDVRVALERCRASYDQGRYEETIAVCRSIAGSGEAYGYLGEAYLVMGDYPSAIDALGAALRFEPSGARLHLDLGIALYFTGELARSIDECDYALRLEPQSKIAWYWIGGAYLGLGQRPEAIEAFRGYLQYAREGLAPADFVASVEGLLAQLEPTVAAAPPPPEPPPPQPQPEPAPADDVDCGNGPYSGTVEPGGEVAFKFHEADTERPVLTLKNLSGASDFDLYAFRDGARREPVAAGRHSGTATELLLASRGSGSGFLYITVRNEGGSTARYWLSCRAIDVPELIGEAIAETLLSKAVEALLGAGAETEEQEANAGRQATVVVSLLEGKDLAGIGQDLLLNEITSRVRQELGYGFVGEVAVSALISAVRDIYRDY